MSPKRIFSAGKARLGLSQTPRGDDPKPTHYLSTDHPNVRFNTFANQLCIYLSESTSVEKLSSDSELKYLGFIVKSVKHRSSAEF